MTTTIDRGQLLRDWLDGKREDLRIGLTQAEQKRYSILKLAAHLLDPNDRAARERAALEIECSDAAQKIAVAPGHGGAFLPAEITGIGHIEAGQNMLNDSSGGFLKDRHVRGDLIIDAMRPHAPLMSLASVLSGLPPGEHEVPRVITGVTAGWIDEDDDAPDTDQTYGMLNLRARTAAANTTLTRSFIKHAVPGAEEMVRSDLGKALGETVETGFWTGTGGRAQPVGLLNWTGIGSVAGGDNGLAPAWSHIVALESDLADGNADSGRLAYITNAKMRGSLKRTPEHATGQMANWIWTAFPGRADSSVGLVNGYPAYVSNLVPSNLVKGGSGAVCSAIAFGNWADMVIGIWGALEIIVNPYTLSKRGAVQLTAFIDCDMILRHEASFSVMQDALEAA